MWRLAVDAKTAEVEQKKFEFRGQDLRIYIQDIYINIYNIIL